MKGRPQRGLGTAAPDYGPFALVNEVRAIQMNKASGIFSLWVLAIATHAADVKHPYISDYAGQETQQIKSLSPDDVEELRRGRGWGLAKAAELNGIPGPIHLLEAKEELGLDDAQIAAITAIYEDMKAKAIEQGEKLIVLELELERRFQNRTIDHKMLRSSLEAIGETRTELRYVHLAAHLQTPEILSADQIDTYNVARGYSGSVGCADVPQGHDAEMWRKHRGCQ